MNTVDVGTVAELVAASHDRAAAKLITITTSMVNVPSIRLQPGQALRGDLASSKSGAAPSLTFASNTDGVQLTTDNKVENLRLEASPDKRALFNDTSVDKLGVLAIHSVSTIGRVQLLARDRIRAGHVEIDGLDILEADSRSERERPREYGVSVLQGAFTLWNMQSDCDISANLIDLSAGRPSRPVLGSGIFVSGAGDNSGKLLVQCLHTKGIYSNGMIAAGTLDHISGGVFVVYGAQVDLVVNEGPVVTYGTNDMALDNWGIVDRWIAKSTVTTRGASGIGCVNFGLLGELRVEAPIVTFGPGSRGFNVYSGTVRSAEFDRVVTHGDGAVGIQVSQRIGRLKVNRGIETFGVAGPSLVKGEVVTLSAVALSVKPGGSARSIEINGGLITHGKGIEPLEQHGVVEELRITGSCASLGDVA